MFYNKLIAAVAIIGSVLPTTLFAQHTKGGSKKSYDKYRYTTEMQVTQREVKNNTYNNYRQSYFYMSVGPGLALSETFTSMPTINSSISSSYDGTDGMGGKKLGGSFSIGGLYAFKKLNDKLHPIIDIGLTQNHTLTLHPYSWSNLIGTQWESEVKTRDIFTFATSFAPTVTINPLYKGKNKLHIDVGYKLGASLFFGGGQENTFTDYKVERNEFTTPVFYHGPSVRLRYSALFVGLDFCIQTDDTPGAYFVRYPSGATDDYYSSLNLSNFAFHLGFAF